MFTGIIENTGIIKAIQANGSNKTFWVASPLSNELKVDQSISHNGVCLTVEEVQDGMHRVTAIDETLLKTNLSEWQVNTVVNLERCMQMNGRLDGHIVQGHVDTTAKCIALIEKEGSWEFTFSFSKEFGALVIEKGSVSINGTSLTCFAVHNNSFSVAIIPYAYNHTNIGSLEKGSIVNIEFDVIGKYVSRLAELNR